MDAAQLARCFRYLHENNTLANCEFLALNDNDFTSLPDDLLATARVNHTMYGRRIAG